MASTISTTTNTSGISVGSDGKVKVSGYSSSIDWQSLIDSQIKARRISATQMETKISANTTKVAAYKEVKTKMADVVTTLDKLRDAPGSTTSVFNSKTVSGSSAAETGYTATPVDSLVLVSLSSAAQAATHTLKINNLATAHQIRADSLTSTTTALATLGKTTGTFTINGQDVAVSSTDTLLDVKSRINNANAGVTATIISSNSTTNYLVLTADDTGVSNAIVLGGDTSVTDSLGLTTSGSIKNQMVGAVDANLDVDGITGITRSSNTVSDLIEGVTLNLLSADTHTTMTLKVEPDLSAVKTAISDFVDAYNAIRSYIDDQRTNKDWNNDGTTEDGEYGPLAYDQTLRDAVWQLGQLASASVSGNDDGYKSLGQVGVVLDSSYTLQVDSTILDAKLLSNYNQIQSLFGLKTTTSDSRLSVLSAGSAVNGSYYVNIAGTGADSSVTSANISTTSGAGAGGADNGSLTVSSRTLTATNTTNANGLSLFFGGAASLGSVGQITVTVSRGIADQFYSSFSALTTTTTGTLDTLVTQLETQNSDYQDRIHVIDDRMDVLRASLTAKYTTMETALAKLETLKNTINSYYDSTNSSN